VTNHGIPAGVVEGMLRVAREFFHLPESERLKCYSDDPKKAIRLSTSFNVRTEKVSNWRDFLRLHCYPLQSFVDQWPSNPPSFRQVVGTYATEARALALRLLEAISESLGLDRSHMVTAMGRQAQHMAVNYYPPCPQPELTYGLPGHKDPNAITLLLQDGVSGLQVQRNGRWVAVNPVPDALVINIGDQLQVHHRRRTCSSSLRNRHRSGAAGAGRAEPGLPLCAGTEQRPLQERAPPRDREQRERADLGADVLLPVAGRGDRAGGGAGGRRPPAGLPALHLPGVLRRVLEHGPRIRELPRPVQTRRSAIEGNAGREHSENVLNDAARPSPMCNLQ